MASVTYSSTKDASAIYDPSGVSNYTSDWNGFDQHHPVGAFSSTFAARSLIYFPISFSGMTSITNATLTLKVTSYHGAFGSNSNKTLYAARSLRAWTEQAGAENSWTNASGTYNSHLYTDTPDSDYATADQTYTTAIGSKTDGSTITLLVTDIVRSWFTGSANNGFVLYNNNLTSTAHYMEFGSRENTTSAYRPTLNITYTTNTAPNAPTNLSPTGGVVVNSVTPTLSGLFSDPDAGDTLSAVNYQVYASDGTTLIYDSGWVAASGTSFSNIYGGSSLTGNVTYKWQARTKDAAGVAGAFSAQQSFIANNVPSAPVVTITTQPSADLGTLTPSINIANNDADLTDSIKSYSVLWKDSSGSTIATSTATGLTAQNITFAYPGTPNLSWGSSYKVSASTTDQNNATSNYSSDQSFATHKTGAPINLAPSGATVSSSIAPTFTGDRSSSAESLTSVQILLYANDESTLIWDSGVLTSGVTSSTFSIGYIGTTLSYSTTYKWKARVTSSVGGTSDYTVFSSFVTPAAGAITQTAPIGSPITSLTPSFQFSRTASFNAYQLIVYASDNTTIIFDSGTVTHASATSKSYTYAGSTALTWNTNYAWKVRVSADSGSTWGSGYSGVVDFTTDAAGIPTITAPTDNAWISTLTPTLSGTTYNSESATAYRILLYGSDAATLIWNSGDISQTAATSFSKVYNGSTALEAGTRYYWQARYTKSTGPVGSYSALKTFKINALPSPSTGLVPTQNQIIIDTVTTPNPTVSAVFVDADQDVFGDYPTLFEAEVSQDSDSVVMYTMSNSASLIAGQNSLSRGATGVTTTAGAGGTTLAYDTTYRVRVRYTDSKSQAGAWTSANQFRITKIPTAAITSPTSSVSSPIVQVNWSFSSPGSKSQYTYQVVVTLSADDTKVYDTGEVISSSGNATIPNGYIQNNTQYKITLVTKDTDLVSSVSNVATVNASWTPPASVTGFSVTLD
jgi:hypothetical protein